MFIYKMGTEVNTYHIDGDKWRLHEWTKIWSVFFELFLQDQSLAFMIKGGVYKEEKRNRQRHGKRKLRKGFDWSVSIL